MMWDACRIFISYDVGCTLDLKESETFRLRIHFCNCGINVGFTEEVNSMFFGTKFVICQNCGGGGEWEGGGIAAAQLFPFFYLQICNRMES